MYMTQYSQYTYIVIVFIHKYINMPIKIFIPVYIFVYIFFNPGRKVKLMCFNRGI